jgi:hypothetical protein
MSSDSSAAGDLSLILPLGRNSHYLVRKYAPTQRGLYKDFSLLGYQGGDRFVVLTLQLTASVFKAVPAVITTLKKGGSKFLRNVETNIRAIMFQKTLTFIINNAVKTSNHNEVL